MCIFDVFRRFNTLNETHYSKSSDSDRGNTRCTSLVKPNIIRVGPQFEKDSGKYTIDCYVTNPPKDMPAVYIYNFNEKDKTKLKIRPGYVEGLHVALHANGVLGGSTEWMLTCVLTDHLKMYSGVHELSQ